MEMLLPTCPVPQEEGMTALFLTVPLPGCVWERPQWGELGAAMCLDSGESLRSQAVQSTQLKVRENRCLLL